jgi:hypothetical protein
VSNKTDVFDSFGVPHLRKLGVDKDVPVHGVVTPWKGVEQQIEMERETTRRLCMSPQGPLPPECKMFPQLNTR